MKKYRLLLNLFLSKSCFAKLYFSLTNTTYFDRAILWDENEALSRLIIRWRIIKTELTSFWNRNRTRECLSAGCDTEIPMLEPDFCNTCDVSSGTPLDFKKRWVINKNNDPMSDVNFEKNDTVYSIDRYDARRSPNFITCITFYNLYFS